MRSQNVYDYHRQSIYDIIVHQYGDWSQAPASRWDRGTSAARAGDGRGTGPRGASAAFGRDSLVALLGDAQVVAPVVAMATFHARHARPGVGTFLYELNPGADDRGTYRPNAIVSCSLEALS